MVRSKLCICFLAHVFFGTFLARVLTLKSFAAVDPGEPNQSGRR